MKKIILILIIIIISFYIPKYNELNNIRIVDKITIECKNNNYNITLREKYISKEDNNQTYKYNYFIITTNNMKNIGEISSEKYHKTFYIKKAKYINKCIKK